LAGETFESFKGKAECAVTLLEDAAPQARVTDLQSAAQSAATSTTTDSLTLTDGDRERILPALRETNWVLGGCGGAAARLGMKRSTLHWQLRKLGISRPD